MMVKLLGRLYKRWNHFEKRLTKKFTRKQKKMWQVLIFLVRFGLLALPLYLLLWLNAASMMAPIQKITAFATERFLNLTGITFLRDGILFSVSSPEGLLAFEISADCIGWKSALAFIGLIFSVRGVSLKKRLAGVVFGLPIIFAGNVLRLGTTFYLVAVGGLSAFNLVHLFLWQWGLILLVLAVWIGWLKFFRIQPIK